MPLEIIYRSDLTIDLTADQVDSNFRSVQTAIEALESDRPTPNEIVSTTQQGLSFSFNLQNGGVLGPITLPVVSFHFFDAWTPFTLRAELDTFVVDGVGIYTTLLAHTTGAAFDAELLVAGSPAYRRLFGFAPDGGSSIIYDLEFQYQGVLADATTAPVNFVALRPFIVPAIGNKARLVTPASVADQVLPILHDLTLIGTVTFVVGDNLGTIDIAADEIIATDEAFRVGLPATPDPTAAGMTLAFAARRVIA